MFRVALLVLAVVAVVLPASGNPTTPGRALRVGETNSDRFARGLPPLKPRKLFDASTVDTALRARQSATTSPFTCHGTAGGPYPVCCQSGVTKQGTDSAGHTEYEAGTNVCYYYPATILTGSSPGCVASTDMPLCCSGPNGTPNASLKPGPYTGTSYVTGVINCEEPIFT